MFGVLLLIADVGYLASSFTTVVLPRYAPVVDQVGRREPGPAKHG